MGEQVLGEAIGGLARGLVGAEAGVQGEAAQGGERLAEGRGTAAQRLGQAACEALGQGIGAAIVEFEEQQIVQGIALDRAADRLGAISSKKPLTNLVAQGPEALVAGRGA